MLTAIEAEEAEISSLEGKEKCWESFAPYFVTWYFQTTLRGQRSCPTLVTPARVS